MLIDELQLQPDRLPHPDGLTFNQVAKRCGITRDDVVQMVGAIERHAGKLPTRQDAQGQTQRYVPESLLMPHFQVAAIIMKTEGLMASPAMEKALGIGLPHYLERLTNLVEQFQKALDLPGEIRRAASALQEAAQKPRVVTVNLEGLTEFRTQTNYLRSQIRFWKVTCGVMAVLVLLLAIRQN